MKFVLAQRLAFVLANGSVSSQFERLRGTRRKYDIQPTSFCAKRYYIYEGHRVQISCLSLRSPRPHTLRRSSGLLPWLGYAACSRKTVISRSCASGRFRRLSMPSGLAWQDAKLGRSHFSAYTHCIYETAYIRGNFTERVTLENRKYGNSRAEMGQQFGSAHP